MRVLPDRVYAAFHQGYRKRFSERVVSSIVKLFTNRDFREGHRLGVNKTRYAHTELIFPKDIAGAKNSFSSRGTDNPSGVSFKNIDYTKHPERWDFQEIKWLSEEYDIKTAYEVALNYDGCPYAYNNVFNTFGFFRTRKDRKGMHDWWCSEINAYVVGIPDYKLSPNKFFTEVVLRNRAFLEVMHG